MTGLQWLLLLSLFTAYLLFGGVIFMVLEQHNEILKKEELNVLRQDVQAILLDMDKEFYSNETSAETLEAIRVAKSAVISRMSDACGGINFIAEEISHLRWNYYNSVFFAFTVITTIGYGHLAPTTDWSRIFVIFYALIGIPINGIVLQGLGTAFSKKLVKVQKKSKEKQYESRFTLVLDILFYLIPGMAVFIVLPAGIFVIIEKWPFVDAIYYAFITLLTIGFGDFVAGAGDDKDIWMWVYKAGIIIWITFGLGYLVMILGYITKGLTHKKVRIVIENRLNTIQKTRDKLSNDVDYMRRVVNELYMLKIKPVFPGEGEDDENGDKYAPDGHQRDRINSEPWNTMEYSSINSHFRSMPPTPKRSRTELRYFAEGGKNGALQRTLSESDLDRIDKCKTFEDAMKQCVLPEELLDAVVQVLNQSVVNDVLEAVDELNQLEEDYDFQNREREPLKVSGDHKKDRRESLDLHAHLHPHNPHPLGLDHEVPWDLGKLNESDEDVLIIDEDPENRSSLSDTDEIVIQVDEDEGKAPSQNLINMVNNAIRKISTNTKPDGVITRKVSTNTKPEGAVARKVSNAKEAAANAKKALNAKAEGAAARKISSNSNPSENIGNIPGHSAGVTAAAQDLLRKIVKTPEGSRKVSRNESDRRRKTSRNEPGGSRSPMRKISQNDTPDHREIERYSPLPHGRFSTPTSPRLERATDARKSGGRSSGGSRKISHDSNPDPSRKISVETTSLADFLRALDNVHHKLQHPHDDETYSGDVEVGLGSSAGSHHQLPTSPPSNHRPPGRKRKVGIFVPTFAFENKAYDPSPDEEKTHKRETK